MASPANVIAARYAAPARLRSGTKNKHKPNPFRSHPSQKSKGWNTKRVGCEVWRLFGFRSEGKQAIEERPIAP
jgi:hypothetical protein